MNNNQFRALYGAERTTPREASTTSQAPALGSRQRSSIPMTPRNIKTGVDFAKQLAAARQGDEPPKKKFRASAAPKGVRLPSGYTDRAAARAEIGNDERELKLKELEAQWREGKLEDDEYERERNGLVGGDVESTHLVKGLDWRLLERSRRGDDVLSEVINGPKAAEEEEPAQEEDFDAALDQVNELDVKPIERETAAKKGTMVPPPQRKSRDALLAQLKASRNAAKPTAPALGAKFKKVGQSTELKPGMTRKEIDEQGREVLIVVAQDGTVKRKVRKASKIVEEPKLEANQKKLGMEVPDWAQAPPVEEEEDDDIFATAGTEYNALGDSSGSDSESDKPADAAKVKLSESMAPPPIPRKPIFDLSAAESKEEDMAASLLSNLQARAASDNPLPKTAEEKQRDDKLAKLQERMARDDEDLDLDFGGSYSYDLGDEDDAGKRKRGRAKGS